MSANDAGSATTDGITIGTSSPGNDGFILNTGGGIITIGGNANNGVMSFGTASGLAIGFPFEPPAQPGPHGPPGPRGRRGPRGRDGAFVDKSFRLAMAEWIQVLGLQM